MIKRINDIVYQIRKEPHEKPQVVHFNRQPYAGSNDVDIEAVRSQNDFDEFMATYTGSSKLRFGVTQEFDAANELASICQAKLRVLDEVRSRKPRVVEVLAVCKKKCPNGSEATDGREAILPCHVELPEETEGSAG